MEDLAHEEELAVVPRLGVALDDLPPRPVDLVNDMRSLKRILDDLLVAAAAKLRGRWLPAIEDRLGRDSG